MNKGSRLTTAVTKNGLCRMSCLNIFRSKVISSPYVRPAYLRTIVRLLHKHAMKNSGIKNSRPSYTTQYSKEYHTFAQQNPSLLWNCESALQVSGNTKQLEWRIFAGLSVVVALIMGCYLSYKNKSFLTEQLVLGSTNKSFGNPLEEDALALKQMVPSLPAIQPNPLAGNDGVKVHVKTSLNGNPIDTLISKIKITKKSLKAAVYKFDNAEVYHALVDALNRGVQVQLVCDKKANYKARANAYKLRSQGAEIHFWDLDKMRKLHAKFTIVDDDYVLTGSSNWTRNADGSNLELVLEFNGDVTEFSNLFSELWSKVKENEL